jgi:hypothetical protein
VPASLFFFIFFFTAVVRGWPVCRDDKPPPAHDSLSNYLARPRIRLALSWLPRLSAQIGW